MVINNLCESRTACSQPLMSPHHLRGIIITCINPNAVAVFYAIREGMLKDIFHKAGSSCDIIWIASSPLRSEWSDREFTGRS
ncbi:hypothetical protein [Paenibacillus sp. OSY-SE]|uniref:hypothetical protein n=1 Tax=Paenibacillus sp. OSY-SE TaxID=1196323 RepID=UPI0012F9F6FB|nr:hypothetical protein [Paenibacillus sp. OSY-SE]